MPFNEIFHIYNFNYDTHVGAFFEDKNVAIFLGSCYVL